LLLAGSAQIVSAFSLGGPIAGDSTAPQGNAFDPDATWQIPALGYALGYNFETAAPKNWGQGYRINTPVIYYGFDASFSSGSGVAGGANSFFGEAGAAAVDDAFTIMNSLTNVSAYSSELSEFPLDTRQQNYTAYNLGMVDVKSETLGLIIEQMGLLDPILYTWSIHNRQGPAPGETCPNGMSYQVVMRNFDPSSYAAGSPVYSPYVNDTLYTYLITEICSPPPPELAYTVPYAVDPGGDAYSPIASFKRDMVLNPKFGQYFTGLTRDDVGGLRQLLNSNNIPLEYAPPGSVELETNPTAPLLLTTTNYGVFLASLLTNSPSALLTNFPGLIINFVATNYVSVIFTNVSLDYSNQIVLPTFTNFVHGGLTNGDYFTNQPGPTIINYDNTTFTTLTTSDLGLFVDQARTNDPVTLLTLYPNLVILNYSVVPVYMLVTNYVSYLTNLTGSPYGNPVPVTVISSIQSAYATNWIYSFGNVITNHFYTNRLVTVQNIFSGPLNGAPYGNPLIIQTNVTHYYTNLISGDFFLIPTNWCGFDVYQSHPLSILPPYTYSYTNTVIFGGFTTNNTPTGTTNLPSSSQYGYIRNYLNSSTNYVYAVYPGICEPTLTVSTNYSTNVIAEYQYSFGNIVTNTFSGNTYVTVIITNITPVFGGTPGQLATNVTVASYYTNFPSGDFFITPSNWCGGFTVLSNYFTNTIYVTNLFVLTNSSATSSNLGQFSETIISQYTNNTYLVEGNVCVAAAPVPEQRRGIERVQFIRANYDSDLGNFFTPFTNTFSIVSHATNQDATETFQRVITRPDFLFSGQDLVFNPTTDTGLGNWPTERSNLVFSNAVAGVPGPGIILPQEIFVYNIGGPALDNYSDLGLMDGQSYLNGFSYNNSLFNDYFVWASYDGSTNPPVVYPQNISLTNLENQTLFRLSPTIAPNAANGTAYSVTFSVTGGQSPYALGLSPQSILPSGLSLTGFTISGTPAGNVPGTYDFILLLSDSGGRTVQYNYSITILY